MMRWIFVLVYSFATLWAVYTPASFFFFEGELQVQDVVLAFVISFLFFIEKTLDEITGTKKGSKK